jgi:hypothetical protein
MPELNKPTIHFVMEHNIEYDDVGDEDGPYMAPANEWDESDILESIKAAISDVELDILDGDDIINIDDLDISIHLAQESDEDTVEYANVDITLLKNPHNIEPADLLSVITDHLTEEFSPEQITETRVVNTTLVEGRAFETTRHENGKVDLSIDNQLNKSTSPDGQVTYYKDNLTSRKEYTNGDIETYQQGRRQQIQYADGRLATYNEKGLPHEGQFGSKERGFDFYTQGRHTLSINTKNDRFDFTDEHTITVQRHWGNKEVYGRNAVPGIFESELQHVTAKNGDRMDFQHGYPTTGTLHYNNGQSCDFLGGNPVIGTMAVDEYANVFGYEKHAKGLHIGTNTYAQGVLTNSIRFGRTGQVTSRPQTTTTYQNGQPVKETADLSFLGVDKIITGTLVNGKEHTGDFHRFTSDFQDVQHRGLKFMEAISHFEHGVKNVQSYVKQPFIHTFDEKGQWLAQVNPDGKAFDGQGKESPTATITPLQKQMISMVVPQTMSTYSDLSPADVVSKITSELSNYGLSPSDDVNTALLQSVKQDARDISPVLQAYSESTAKQMIHDVNARMHTPSQEIGQENNEVKLTRNAQ